MDDFERDHLVNNIVGHLKNAKKSIQARQISLFAKADAEWGRRVEEGIAKASL